MTPPPVRRRCQSRRPPRRHQRPARPHQTRRPRRRYQFKNRLGSPDRADHCPAPRPVHRPHRWRGRASVPSNTSATPRRLDAIALRRTGPAPASRATVQSGPAPSPAPPTAASPIRESPRTFFHRLLHPSLQQRGRQRSASPPPAAVAGAAASPAHTPAIGGAAGPTTGNHRCGTMERRAASRRPVAERTARGPGESRRTLPIDSGGSAGWLHSAACYGHHCQLCRGITCHFWRVDCPISAGSRPPTLLPSASQPARVRPPASLPQPPATSLAAPSPTSAAAPQFASPPAQIPAVAPAAARRHRRRNRRLKSIARRTGRAAHTAEIRPCSPGPHLRLPP